MNDFPMDGVWTCLVCYQDTGDIGVQLVAGPTTVYGAAVAAAMCAFERQNQLSRPNVEAALVRDEDGAFEVRGLRIYVLPGSWQVRGLEAFDEHGNIEVHANQQQIERSGALTAADRAIWRAAFAMEAIAGGAYDMPDVALRAGIRKAARVVEAARAARAFLEVAEPGDDARLSEADLAMARDALGEEG